jgi:hypothetical protein
MSQPKENMKVVGGRNMGSLWDRFDRLQRTAYLVLPQAARPRKGVFAFRNHEDYEQWKKAQLLAFLKRTT